MMTVVPAWGPEQTLLTERDHRLMHGALHHARIALANGAVPAGMIVTVGGRILAGVGKSGRENHLEAAEVRLFKDLFESSFVFGPTDEVGLYTTLAPCLALWRLIERSPINRVVYALDESGGLPRSLADQTLDRWDGAIRIVSGVRRPEALALWRTFSGRSSRRSASQ